MFSLKILFYLLILCILASAKYISSNRSCQCVCGQKGRYTRIIGGKEIVPHSHPWTTALFKNNVLYCGATVISNNYVLTAAHCIYTFSPNEIIVHVGGHDIIKDQTETITVASMTSHEKFDAVTFNNDIGLIKLSQSIQYGARVQPACLPFQRHRDVIDYSGELGLVSGWGRVGEVDETSNVLNYIIVPIWSHKKCSSSGYGPKRLTRNMMCAGYEEGLFDACQGDSGGAMLREQKSGGVEIIGIISWGRGCARPNYPGIYTIVEKYIDWLEPYLHSECICLKNSKQGFI